MQSENAQKELRIFDESGVGYSLKNLAGLISLSSEEELKLIYGNTILYANLYSRAAKLGLVEMSANKYEEEPTEDAEYKEVGTSEFQPYFDTIAALKEAMLSKVEEEELNQIEKDILEAIKDFENDLQQEKKDPGEGEE